LFLNIYHRHRFDGDDGEGKAKNTGVSPVGFALPRVYKGRAPFVAGGGARSSATK